MTYNKRNQGLEAWLPGERHMGCVALRYRIDTFHHLNAAHYVRNHAHLPALLWARVTRLLRKGKTWRTARGEPLVCIFETV